MENLFLMVVKMGITAVPVILGVFLVRLFLRRAPKQYSYVLWTVVGLRLVFPFSISSIFSVFNLKFFQKAGVGKNIVQPVMGELSGTQALRASETGQKIMNTAAENISISQMQTQSGGNFRQYVLWAATAIWVAGMLVCLVYFLASWIRVKKNVKRAVHWKENIWECEEVDSPFVMGVFQPRIYIPFRLDDFQRKMLLLHETYHIRRKDYLVKLFAYFLTAVYWFQPLVWVSYFAMMRDMEMSCDEWVLKCLGTNRKKEYSRLLLDFAVKERTGAQSGILGFGENSTKSRIRNILNFRHLGRWTTGALALLCAAVAIFLGTNGTEKEDVQEKAETEAVTLEAQGGEYDELAERLYGLKNPYVGDASADGKLFRAVCESQYLTDDFWSSYEMELETEEEPYVLWFRFDKEPDDPAAAEIHMIDCGNLMLALIDNLSEVQFTYPTDIHEKTAVETGAEAGTEMEGTAVTLYWDLEAAKANLWGKDIKKYGESPESLEELLAMLNDGRQRKVPAVKSEGIWGSMEAVPEAVPETEKDIFTEYVLEADVSEEESMMLPALALNEEEHTFSFSYDLLSSYLSVGTYEIKKDILTAMTDDGLYQYQFKVIDEDTLEFMGEASSEVRLIQKEMGVAVEDGAKFTRRF